jgi:hypothetical protein
MVHPHAIDLQTRFQDKPDVGSRINAGSSTIITPQHADLGEVVLIQDARSRAYS